MTPPIETMTHEHAVDTMAPERYLLEEMSELERHAFEEHAFSCADCADDVRTFELMRAGLRESRGAETIPFVPRSAGRRWSVITPWAAAASLALVVGYQAISPATEGPYVVEPVTLRPTSRGAGAVVRVAPGERAVVLAVDAETTGVREWFYEIATVDGDRVAAGRARVPAAGGPLLLVVPAPTLKAPGQYVLSLRESEAAPLTNEYRFEVAASPAQP